MNYGNTHLSSLRRDSEHLLWQVWVRLLIKTKKTIHDQNLVNHNNVISPKVYHG